MKEYRYEGINSEGIHLSGSIQAENAEAAQKELFNRGIAATKLQSVSSLSAFRLRTFFSRSVPLRDIILFTKQFRTLLSAGVAITEVLRMLQHQTENNVLRSALADIHQHILEGGTLHTAFARHARIFPPLYCAMLRAGETSGALDEVLSRLSYMLDHEEKTRKQIDSALRYPKMVLVCMAFAFLFLLNFIIPKFASIFRTANIELPLPTRIAISMNEHITEWWWIVVPSVLALIMGLRWWLTTPSGKLWKDALALRIPIAGPVVQKSMLARFAAIFSLLQKSGVSLIDSLDILGETLDNALIARQFAEVKNKLTSGQGLSGPISEITCMTPLAINMIQVGESSGHLDLVMEEMARHYDDEVEFAVSRMADSIAPLLLILLGILVLFFALAIFMPMWDMSKLAM